MQIYSVVFYPKFIQQSLLISGTALQKKHGKHAN